MDGHHDDTTLAKEVARVRRRIEDAMRVLAEADMHLPVAEELRGVRPAQRDADLIDQYRIKLEVALKEASGWALLFSRATERAAAGVANPTGDEGGWRGASVVGAGFPDAMHHSPLVDASAAISPSRLNVSA